MKLSNWVLRVKVGDEPRYIPWIEARERTELDPIGAKRGTSPSTHPWIHGCSPNGRASPAINGVLTSGKVVHRPGLWDLFMHVVPPVLLLLLLLSASSQLPFPSLYHLISSRLSPPAAQPRRIFDPFPLI